MDISIDQDQIWMVVVGFIIAFVLAFGIGANDVANSFGTSVGSRVLTLKQACILASVFETLGAVLLGAKVSDTIRKGVIDVELYRNDTSLLMMGNVAALSGSCVWLLAATMLRLPVSGTHSIVGATVGYALVIHGNKGIKWGKVGLIIGSWFISPLLAGLVSTGFFFFCKYFILNKRDPIEPGLRWMPVFYGFALVINAFSVFYEGPEMLYFDRIPLWGIFLLSFGIGIISAIIVRVFLVPYQRKRIKASLSSTTMTILESGSGSDSLGTSCSADSVLLEKTVPPGGPEVLPLGGQEVVPLGGPEVVPLGGQEVITLGGPEMVPLGGPDVLPQGCPEETPLGGQEVVSLGCDIQGDVKSDAPLNNLQSIHSTDDKHGMDTKEDTVKSDDIVMGRRNEIVDRPETARIFSFLQILTAVFGAFAHGGNDVSNAISPLVTVWLVATSGDVEQMAMTPIWILVYGGLGISLGLCVLGRRVIKTMGEDLAKITPSSGFCIEIGSALTVLVASNIGVPVSTTHCKVGSVVFVGRFRSRDNVDWSLFRNIVLAWLVTLPITGGISAAIMACFQFIPH